MVYIYDGSFSGYLTSVFECFADRQPDAEVYTSSEFQHSFFVNYKHVQSSTEKEKRVYEGLIKNLGKEGALDFWRNYLSEDPRAIQSGFRIMKKVFRGDPGFLQNYGDPDVLLFAQTLKKVNRERHRMKAFVRFSKASDGLYFAVIEPDFNVLPLVAGFFRDRYADQKWLIYDLHRNYGLLYDIRSLNEVSLMPEAGIPNGGCPAMTISLDEREEQFRRLWQRYFKSTTIEARRNMKLHLQHVPRRYWKYLTEKSL